LLNKGFKAPTVLQESEIWLRR